MVVPWEFRRGIKNMEALRLLSSVKHRISFKSCCIKLFHVSSTFFRTFQGIPSRELLVLDEAHRLEEEIVKFAGISISKRRWKRYIPDFEMVDYGYDDRKVD